MLDDSNDMINAVTAGVSAIRLSEYLGEVGGDSDRAIELYAWNSRMASECFIAIGHVEVLLRNAIDKVLREYFHEESCGIPWFLQFRSPLKEDEKRSIEEARSHIGNVHSPHVETRDRIVAQLTFGFWSRLFGPKYDELWKKCLYRAFSNGSNPKVTRKEIASLVESVRITRNRVAHQNYMKAFDVPKAMKEILRLAELISIPYKQWLVDYVSQWRETYDQCPKIDVDTLVVPGRVAWDIYRCEPIYVCRPGRFFRDMKYLAYYEQRCIRAQVPRILRVYEKVEWSEDRARILLASDDELDRRLGKALQWALTDDGVKVAHGWANYEQGYKVFLLTRKRSHQSGEDGHMILPQGDVPHIRQGAFVQNHRYTSIHALLTAQSTDDLESK